jgi:hypothetical protein
MSGIRLYCVNCSLSDEGKGSNLNDVLSRGRHGHERMIVGFTIILILKCVKILDKT